MKKLIYAIVSIIIFIALACLIYCFTIEPEFKELKSSASVIYIGDEPYIDVFIYMPLHRSDEVDIKINFPEGLELVEQSHELQGLGLWRYRSHFQAYDLQDFRDIPVQIKIANLPLIESSIPRISVEAQFDGDEELTKAEEMPEEDPKTKELNISFLVVLSALVLIILIFTFKRLMHVQSEKKTELNLQALIDTLATIPSDLSNNDFCQQINDSINQFLSAIDSSENSQMSILMAYEKRQIDEALKDDFLNFLEELNFKRFSASNDNFDQHTCRENAQNLLNRFRSQYHAQNTGEG